MKQTITRSSLKTRFAMLSLGLLMALSGCMGMGFTPQMIAVQEARNYSTPDFRVDAGTIQVLQEQPAGDSQFVLVSFQGMQQNAGRMACTYTYEMHKSSFGAWVTGGGGGGCSNQAIQPDKEPISVGGSSGSGGGPGDQGYSSTSGLVFSDDIQQIKVTWKDGTEQTVAVINHSYLAPRSGLFEMQKVEALDANQKVVYTNEPQVDPAKQQLDSSTNP